MESGKVADPLLGANFHDKTIIRHTTVKGKCGVLHHMDCSVVDCKRKSTKQSTVISSDFRGIINGF